MKKSIFIFILLGFTLLGHAQFKGALTMGVTANQIDGDQLAGFNKLGLTGGVVLLYPIRERFDIGLELLYTQRGSAPKLDPNAPNTVDGSIHLDYLEMLLMVRINDWYIEDEDYYKAFLDLGLSMGYLFNVNAANDIFEGTIGKFNRYDLSVVLGAGYSYSKRWTLGITYTRSILPIYNEKVFRGRNAYAYNWSLKAFYNL